MSMKQLTRRALWTMAVFGGLAGAHYVIAGKPPPPPPPPPATPPIHYQINYFSAPGRWTSFGNNPGHEQLRRDGGGVLSCRGRRRLILGASFTTPASML